MREGGLWVLQPSALPHLTPYIDVLRSYSSNYRQNKGALGLTALWHLKILYLYSVRPVLMTNREYSKHVSTIGGGNPTNRHEIALRFE